MVEHRISCFLILSFVLTSCSPTLPVIPEEPPLNPVASFSSVTSAVIPLVTSEENTERPWHKTALWSERLMVRPKGTTDLVATQVVVDELRALGFHVLDHNHTTSLAAISKRVDVVFSGNSDLVYLGFYRAQPYLEGHFRLTLKVSSAQDGELLWQKSVEGKALVVNEEKNRETFIRRATQNAIRKLIRMNHSDIETSLKRKK